MEAGEVCTRWRHQRRQASDALTLDQWARRAHDVGIPEDMIVAGLDGDPDNHRQLAGLIHTMEANRAADKGTTQVDRARIVEPSAKGAAPAGAEPKGQGESFTLANPEPKAEPAPRVDTQGGLFAPATTADHVRAAGGASDAERNGQNGGHADTGDGGLFDGKRPDQVDLGNVADKTTSYGDTSPVRDSPERGGVAEPARAVRGRGRNTADVPDEQFDLFSAEGEPVSATRGPVARLLQKTKLVSTGVFHSGVKRIRGWKDAAHIIAPLRKSPQEQMLAVVADADGKPLAVLRHTVGLINQADVSPSTVFGAIAQVPGAKQVWFAHNHPSGVPNQSMADLSITRKLHDLMRGSGIQTHGMIVVAPNSKLATQATGSGLAQATGSGLES